MMERAHRQIKDALRTRLAGVEWLQHLPCVLLGLRAAPKEDSAISSAELVFGAALTLPGQFLATMEQSPADYIKQLQSSTALPTRLATEKLMKAEYVFVRCGGMVPPLALLYHRPYKVLQAGSKFFTINLGGHEEGHGLG